MAFVPQDATNDVQHSIQQLNDELTEMRARISELHARLGTRDPDLVTQEQLSQALSRPKHFDFRDVFRAAGPAHSIGYVPSNGVTMSGAMPEGHERVLREDAVWRMPQVQGPFKIQADDPHDKYNLQGHLNVAGGLYASKITTGDADFHGHVNARVYRGIVIAAFAFSSGQNNGATTGSDVQLTSYDVPIPANLLQQPGDALVIDATWYGLTVAAATRTAKLDISGSGKKTIFTTSTSLANMVMPARTIIRRRTSTTGSATGITLIDASASSPTGGLDYLQNSGLSGIDWTTNQTLQFFANSTVASTLGLTDMHVTFFPAQVGVTV
jgi:hypothetical protein